MYIYLKKILYTENIKKKVCTHLLKPTDLCISGDGRGINIQNIYLKKSFPGKKKIYI